MKSAVIRLAGSGQSYASSPFQMKSTEGVPTRSALLGLIGAALGIRRGENPAWFEDLTIWVRVDRSGTVEVEYQTISAPPEDLAESRSKDKHASTLYSGPARTSNYTVPRGQGGRWEVRGATTMETRRAYLSGAEFIVAISHPDDEKVATVAAALRSPEFLTYLGRRVFAPTFPYALGIHEGSPEQLMEKLPTGSARAALPVHRIVGDKNYVSAHVSPERRTTPADLWKGWKP
ncbi:type I-E CRISPR-associated protein Cas5/CasD [Leifsonia sp. Leaf264]|uniref:type I-E CRISPR-associated protein Cas5/CasD n=1 Tax=Leifsonia sp. Leaf264 TaxID=1736314 RepID=UPI000700DBDF|nr:type I-E CRISPR-associated protein Cas5/CasD [Leifsonia sp. Leaf264]KQO98763.1 hypothetical protein ASF30_11925 [Leifsonia sp. Leaf264]